MKRKIDQCLMCIFLLLLPVFLSGSVLLFAWGYFVIEDVQTLEVFLVAATIMSAMFVIGAAINAILGFVSWIREKIRLRKLDKYYEEHPEKERENREAFARDLESLANAMRNNDE